MVTSFNWLSIERVRELAPEVRTGFLTTPAIDPRAALMYARQNGHAFVLPHAYALVDAGEASSPRPHADGVRVWAWTVDDPQDIARLFDWGVDAVVTNDPATAVRVREALAERDRSGEDRQRVRDASNLDRGPFADQLAVGLDRERLVALDPQRVD